MSAETNVRRLRRSFEEFRTRFASRRTRSAISGDQGAVTRAGTPPDVRSVRAKSSGHRKVTADKWNQ